MRLFEQKPIPDIERLIERYIAGESAQKLAKEVGVKGETLTRRFKAAGVEIRGRLEASKTARVRIENLNELIEDYNRGISLAEISRETGIERIVLTARFKEVGVKLRGRSEAEILKWEQKHDDRNAIRNQMSKAWEARRGRKDPIERQARRAETRYRKQTHTYRFEKEVADILHQSGVAFQRQFPVGPFNLDLVIESARLAIEVTNSGWDDPARRAREARRADYILNQGWCILYIKTYTSSGYTRRAVFRPEIIARCVLSFLERLAGDAALIGKYGVVRGDGQTLLSRTTTLDGLPRILDL